MKADTEDKCRVKYKINARENDRQRRKRKHNNEIWIYHGELCGSSGKGGGLYAALRQGEDRDRD